MPPSLRLLPARLALPRLKTPIPRARNISQTHTGQNKHHRASPRHARHKIPRPAPAEHLLASAAKRTPQPPSAPLLQQDDKDEKQANKHVDNAEQGGHGAALGRLLTPFLAKTPATSLAPAR
jgi:hypothetical protein